MNFVSLGGNCSVAYQLDKLGLRHNSYPFYKIDYYNKINTHVLKCVILP